MSDSEARASLAAARQQAGLSLFDLWIAYIGMGGDALPRQLAAFLSGAEHPSASQYDMVAHSLNERFVDMELNHAVPYSGDGAEGDDAQGGRSAVALAGASGPGPAGHG